MEISRETYEKLVVGFTDFKLTSKTLPDPKYFRHLAGRPDAIRILSHMYYMLSGCKRSILFCRKGLGKDICERIVNILYNDELIGNKLNNLKSLFGMKYAMPSMVFVVILMDEELTDQVIDYYEETKNERDLMKLLRYAKSTPYEAKILDLLVSGRVILSGRICSATILAPWLITIPNMHINNLRVLINFILNKKLYCRVVTPELLEATRYSSISTIYRIYRYPPKVTSEYLDTLPVWTRRWFVLDETKPTNAEELNTYIYVQLSSTIKKIDHKLLRGGPILSNLLTKIVAEYPDMKFTEKQYNKIRMNTRIY